MDISLYNTVEERASPSSRVPNEDDNPNAYQLYRRVLITHPDQREAIWGNVRNTSRISDNSNTKTHSQINPPFPQPFALFNIFPVEIQWRVFRCYIEPRPRIINIAAVANNPPDPDADVVIFDHHAVVAGTSLDITPILQTNKLSRKEVLRLYTDEQLSSNRH